MMARRRRDGGPAGRTPPVKEYERRQSSSLSPAQTACGGPHRGAQRHSARVAARKGGVGVAEAPPVAPNAILLALLLESGASAWLRALAMQAAAAGSDAPATVAIFVVLLAV